MNRWAISVVAASAAFVSSSSLCWSGTTLFEALESAYATNPTLKAERARLRSTDEEMAQAVSAWRPTVNASGSYGRIWEESENVSGGSETERSYDRGTFGLQLQQDVYRGGETYARMKRAEHLILAGRAELRRVEQTVFVGTASSFMNVVRDEIIVGLRRRNVRVIDEQMRATRARFDVGEITRTDVAQAEARLSRAKSDLATAEANLAVSKASFARISGASSDDLDSESGFSSRRRYASLTPSTLEEAIAIAETNRPDVISARHSERAAREGIEIADAALLPRVTFETSYDYLKRANVDTTRGTGSSLTNSGTMSLLGNVTVPIYQGGAEYSRIRQARQQTRRSTLLIRDAIDLAREEAIRSWNLLTSSRRNIESARAQVTASRIAFEGVGQEARVGSRTTIEVLNAEQELLDAEVSLIAARRNEVAARHQLLAAVGRLTASDLGIESSYDPDRHYRAVRRSLIGYETPPDGEPESSESAN